MIASKLKAALRSKGWGTTGTGPLPTDDLSGPARDSLFLSQLEKPDPTALNAESLFTAKICETHYYANSVFKDCQKYGIIDSAGHPDTSKINRSMVNRIGIISVPKQRELVNMLFFWEEELMRWRLLDQEAAEIEQAINTTENVDLHTSEMQDRLTAVKAMKRVVPSGRKQDGTLKEERDPPAYAA